MHTVAGVGHASDPLLNIGEVGLDRHTLRDLAIYLFHGHHLVEPGMTMPEVAELIVFADELIDPPSATPPNDGLVLAELALEGLFRAGSVRFSVSGGRHGNCKDEFSGDLTIKDLVDGRPNVWRFDGSGNADRYHADPLWMLISILRYADSDDIRVSRPNDASLRLNLTLDRHSSFRPVDWNWARGLTIDVSVTLDAESLLMTAYSMDWDVDVTGNYCSQYKATGVNAEYGIDIPDPR